MQPVMELWPSVLVPTGSGEYLGHKTAEISGFVKFMCRLCADQAILCLHKFDQFRHNSPFGNGVDDTS